MTRTSRKEVETLFRYLVAAMGGRVATADNPIDGWVLEYNRYPHGYRLYQLGEHGSQSERVFGSKVRSARDMADTIRFTLDAIRETRKNAG